MPRSIRESLESQPLSGLVLGVLIVGPPILDGDVLVLGEACLLEALAKRDDEVRRIGERHAAQESDQWLRGLLPLRRERPRSGCAAEKRDEVSPSHGLPSQAQD